MNFDTFQTVNRSTVDDKSSKSIACHSGCVACGGCSQVCSVYQVFFFKNTFFGHWNFSTNKRFGSIISETKMISSESTTFRSSVLLFKFIIFHQSHSSLLFSFHFFSFDSAWYVTSVENKTKPIADHLKTIRNFLHEARCSVQANISKRNLPKLTVRLMQPMAANHILWHCLSTCIWLCELLISLLHSKQCSFWYSPYSECSE